jgi:hypothetical protein
VRFDLLIELAVIVFGCCFLRSEVGQCASRAAVYTENGGWQPADSGLSNIDVYLNPSTASYRVVALDTNNPSSVSINSNVWADLTYQKASSTFHQWRDQV